MSQGAWTKLIQIATGGREDFKDRKKRPSMMSRGATWSTIQNYEDINNNNDGGASDDGMSTFSGVSAAAAIHLEDPTISEKHHIYISPILSAGCAIEMMGWIVHGWFLNHLSKTTVNRDVHSHNSSEVKSEESVSISSDSTRLGQWVMVMEAATHETQALSVREAAAKALRTSGVLGRYACQAYGANSCFGSTTVEDEQGAEYACRLWLIALRLMQDDDTDVRSLTNAAVSEASNTLLDTLPEQMEGMAVSSLAAKLMQEDEFNSHGVENTVLEATSALHSVSLQSLHHLMLSSSIASLFCTPTPLVLKQGSPFLSGRSGMTPSKSKGYTAEKETENSVLSMIEILPCPADLNLVQGRLLELMTPCLSLVMAWSANCFVVRRDMSGGHEVCRGGVGARIVMKEFYRLGGRLGDMEKLMSINNNTDGIKIFEKDQENLYNEAVLTTAVLAAAIGAAIALLKEPQASLLWKPILERAEKAFELLHEMIRAKQQTNQAITSRICGVCFDVDFFCFVFSSLRAVSEVARVGHPSVQLFNALSKTQLAARTLLEECGNNLTENGECIVHPKIYQLIVCHAVRNE
eukprot:CAMPEP_0182424358 /NCGR_PEP_ID=MMETSP1167-20130531/10568_1 /TAXON_ID=2988 /ORGANISM="Mallomonas Sp, Strain CCMP3275" /LENGTH=578 /DNA_ID=CAMNT_0024604123 /DNA_START=413 /DNA_END=2149 /DNA_ORIENTATION=-